MAEAGRELKMKLSRIVPLGQIISAAEAQTYTGAQDALAKARQEARQLLVLASQETIKVKNAAYQEGMAQSKDEASAIILKAYSDSRTTILGLKREIADAIAVGVAKVVGEMRIGAAVARAATVAISGLTSRQQVQIRVAPACLRDVKAAMKGHEWIAVEGDANLPDDECQLVTASGVIQAGLSRQINVIREALMDTGLNNSGAEQ